MNPLPTASGRLSGDAAEPAPPAADLFRPHWEHFGGTSGFKLRGYGRTPEAAFAQAALALTGMITDPMHIEPCELFAVDRRGQDLDTLLLEWLVALADAMAAHKTLFSAFDISIDGHHLHGTAWGQHLSDPKHHPALQVEALCLRNAHVVRSRHDGWVAECSVDIVDHPVDSAHGK